ncbi:MAG TPA: ABC transporter permease [Blastocatellia bacterium]|nr:ABC transporter permease [Blastocatellia bacterium]
MQNFRRDLRFSVRVLLRQPAVTLVSIITLALGIGAGSAIFSVVNAVLLRPLPFREPEALIRIWETFQPGGYGTASVPNLKDWREQNEAFTALAAYQFANYGLQGREQPERVAAATVSANFFELLGVPPHLGRAFREDEEAPGRNRIVVLSDQLWRQNFAADPGIIGKNILLDGQSYTVTGVMPPGFRFPTRRTALWVPLEVPENQRNNRGNHWLFVLARLKPGVTLAQADQQMKTIAARLEQQYPQAQAGRSVRLVPLSEEVVRNVRPALLMLMAAVSFVLLIACANVASLLLARATARRREMAIRAAIGAGRAQLIAQLLTESVLLALISGVLGLGVAKLGLSALLRLAETFLPRANEISLDGRVVAFTLGLSVLTGIAFGLAPALQVSRTDVQDALKDGGHSGSSPRRNRLRSALVVAEIALSLVLLVGAGLLIRSFWRLQQMDAGLRPENVLTMKISLPDKKYPAPQLLTGFCDRLLETVASLPGVQAAGVINMLPIQETGYNGDFYLEGQGPYPPGQAPLAEYRRASPDYFRAMGIELIAGRFFGAQDREGAQPVAIINQALAQKYLASENPVGKRFRFDPDGPWFTIIGVTRDVRQSGLTQTARPEIVLPFAQAPVPGLSLVVRTAGEPAALTDTIRRAVLAIDPNQPVYNVQTMQTVIDDSISSQRLNMVLLAIFAAVALGLAVTGIYSVMSYLVTQHTRDIGIRMALGARPADVLRLVVGQGMTLTAGGMVIGVAGAFALTRLMASLLFGVTATDALTFIGVPLLLFVTALLACYVPARRATRVDPVIALRTE